MSYWYSCAVGWFSCGAWLLPSHQSCAIQLISLEKFASAYVFLIAFAFITTLGVGTDMSVICRFLIEEWKFLSKEEVLPLLPISDKIWKNLSRRIDEKVIEV